MLATSTPWQKLKQSSGTPVLRRALPEDLEFENVEDQANAVSCDLWSFVSGRVNSGDKKLRAAVPQAQRSRWGPFLRIPVQRKPFGLRLYTGDDGTGGQNIREKREIGGDERSQRLAIEEDGVVVLCKGTLEWSSAATAAASLDAEVGCEALQLRPLTGQASMGRQILGRLNVR